MSRRQLRRGLQLMSGVVLAALLITACGRGKHETKGPAAATGGEPEAVRVRVAEAVEQVADETLSVTGSIFAGTDVKVGTKIAGRVIAIGPDEGQAVPRGRVLVRLDDRDAEANLRQALGALDSARANLSKAQINQHMVQVQADTTVASAQADLTAAKARLAQATESLRLAETKSGKEGVDIAQAESAVVNAKSRLTQAEESLRLAKEQTRNNTTSAGTQVASAQAAVQAAKAGVNQAETSLKLTESTLQSGVDSAQQQVIAARNSLQILNTGSRSQERAQAQSQVEVARVALNNAEVEYNRAKYLFEHGAIAKQQLDGATLGYQSAQERLRQAQEQLSLVQEGPRQEEVRIAETQLRQAEQALDVAKSRQEREVALRRDDVVRAKQEQTRAEQALTAARAGEKTAVAAERQVQIEEQSVAQAKQGVEQAEQAARLARAGVSQAEIARQEVAAAKTAVKAAEERLRLATANLATPRLNREDIKGLAGMVRQAEAGVASARVYLNDHVVAAPLSGTVAERMVESGEVVSPGQPLYRVVSDDMVHFEALVPEEKVRFVSVGMPVTVKVDAVPDAPFSGHVIEILPAADARSRTFTVKVGIPNDNGRLREGMFARGDIVVQPNRRTLRVPVEAVVYRGEEAYVVRLEAGDQAVPLKIVTGGTRAGTVEVAEGDLQPGDRVVVEGAAEIDQPQPVKVIDGAAGEALAPAEAPEGGGGGMDAGG